MALNIPVAASLYSMQVAAHQFRQGGRDVYYFVLDMATLDGVLPQRVDDSIVKEANRKLTPSHAKNIQMYLGEKQDWLLGAMLLGIAPDAVEFESMLNNGSGASNFGILSIRANRANTLRIFDGQHRRRAIQDVLADLADRDDGSDRLGELRASSLAVVMYAEDDITTLRQMFVDASKNKRIEQHTVTRFDQRDPFNITAVRLADESRLFKSRVEMERTSVSRYSQSLITINQLAAALKTLELGYNKRPSRSVLDDLMLKRDDLYFRCKEWADLFLPKARSEYAGLLNGKIDNADIPEYRTTTFSYSVTFIRILAACYRLWMETHNSWDQLADFVSEAELGYGIGRGLLVDAGMTNPEGTKLFARRQEVERAINYIMREAEG